MKVSRILVVAGLVLPALLACGGKEEDGDNGGSGIDTTALCEQGCATTASLMCPRTDSCMQDCQALIDQGRAMFPNCSSQGDALALCYSTKPVSDWECVTTGTARPKASVCSNEVAAFFTCGAG